MGILEKPHIKSDGSNFMTSVDLDLLFHIKSKIPGMSKSDAKIARLLLKSPEEFIRSNVRTIALNVGVSEPTIVRFCRNVGCEGFKDLKFKVMQGLAVSKVYSDAPEFVADALRVPIYGKTEPHGVSEGVFNKAVEAMRSTSNSTDYPTLKKAALAIIQSNRIFLYGGGGSSGRLANELKDCLVRLNVTASVFNDDYGQLMSAATVGTKDLVILISPSGRSRTLQDSLELAKHYGATCIAITDSGNLLGREADICLHVAEYSSDLHEFQLSPSRYSQLLVVDSLAFILASEMGDKARQSLRRVHASVAPLTGLSSKLPLLD